MDASSSSRQLKRTHETTNLAVEGIEHNDKRQRIVIDLTTPICSACQTLDVESAFQKAYEHYELLRPYSDPEGASVCRSSDNQYFYDDAFMVHQFDRRLSRPSECPLCQFFRSLRIMPDRYKSYKLLAFSSVDHWLFRRDYLLEMMTLDKSTGDLTSPIFMAVVPDVSSIPPNGHEVSWLEHQIPAAGAIFHHSVDESDKRGETLLLTARELSPRFDSELLRSWLDTCGNLHGSLCNHQASQEPIMRGFRLINCTESPPIVEDMPWGTTYAALSYVWGTAAGDGQAWPKTVLDACHVVAELGLSYLWIDRLCINQNDPAEVEYLVSKMTTIYEAAHITIVAAADGGASRGLPGVRSTPRKPQPKYFLDSGNQLLSILPDPRRDILASEYWTRGWTYQEGILSNRRIVFTESQVYWECRCMAAQESAHVQLFHEPATEKEEDSNMVMTDFMLTGIFKGTIYSGEGPRLAQDIVVKENEDFRTDYGFPIDDDSTVLAQLRGLNEHVREFSKRRLTYETDSLLAFQGIIGMFKQNDMLHLLHGLPVWTGELAGDISGTQITLALSVSSWYHRVSTDQSMYVSESCKRRPLLPSWTWAGWGGTVTWRAPPNAEHCALMNDLIQATTPSLVWAAELYLSHPECATSIRLSGIRSNAALANGLWTLLEVRRPYILNAFQRLENKNTDWSWRRLIGSVGRKRLMADHAVWDTKWYRIGRRLAVIGMSIALTEHEWTEKHTSGELISVLLFAGRYPNTKQHQNHGTARYLTLRRVQSTPERWERVGTLYLTIPFLADCRDVAHMFEKIPARRYHRDIVIQ